MSGLREIVGALAEPDAFYAGIGSRLTPPDILLVFERCARFLAKKGMVLRSGAAEGADSAFERGADRKEIFLPARRWRRHPSHFYAPASAAFDIAATIHPHWFSLSPFAKLLHARNCHQILGPDLSDPVKFVVFWSPLDSEGLPTGGTRTGVVLAMKHNIPCFTGSPDSGWRQI